jgi:hypothetical protein
MPPGVPFEPQRTVGRIRHRGGTMRLGAYPATLGAAACP